MSEIIKTFLNAPQSFNNADFTKLIDFFIETIKNYNIKDLFTSKELKPLFEKSNELRVKNHEHIVKMRGLVEISSFCKNNCLYCGIRAGNKNAVRYRLTPEEIIGACEKGYALGFRTFVLQGGEDAFFIDEILCEIIRKIKDNHPDTVITLSLGERGENSFKRLFEAGAQRYLLRHETADEEHYKKLHPPEMSHKNRVESLYLLKKIGFQVGAGFMVGSPFQTAETLAKDLIFLRDLNPPMVGLGPFVKASSTPFADFDEQTFGNENATDYKLKMTCCLLAAVRILLPKAYMPSTTALGTIHPIGREYGIRAGANVVMPNLSPTKNRADYALYDGKICTGEEAAECRMCLSKRMESIGFSLTGNP
jgi:biotin synthase